MRALLMIGMAGLVAAATPVRADSIALVDVPYDAANTFAAGINNGSQITGYYRDGSNVAHSFIDTAGSFTSFDIAGSNGNSFAQGINDTGTVAGYYFDGSGGVHGFIRGSGGTASFNVAGDTSYTVISGINNAGDFAGYFQDGAGFHAFANVGGITTTFDVAGATGGSFAQGISNHGALTGNDVTSVTNGFIDDSGMFSYFGPPVGASSIVSFGINSSNTASGYYRVGSTAHGFVRRGTTLTTIDIPGAVDTFVQGINDAGKVTGYYTDALGKSHGFSDALSEVSVAEPASLPVLLAGIAALSGLRRRRVMARPATPAMS